MNSFFLTYKTITDKEQLKHLAFCSPEKVEQRLSNMGQALKSNSGVLGFKAAGRMEEDKG